jgi:hypothetical protein
VIIKLCGFSTPEELYLKFAIFEIIMAYWFTKTLPKKIENFGFSKNGATFQFRPSKNLLPLCC